MPFEGYSLPVSGKREVPVSKKETGHGFLRSGVEFSRASFILE
jgi:hypothetical protein